MGALKLVVKSNASIAIRLATLLTQRRHDDEAVRVLERAKGAEPRNPDLLAALGSAYLGGVRLSVLRRAHRVVEHTPGHVDALTLAFIGACEPHCPEVF